MKPKWWPNAVILDGLEVLADSNQGTREPPASFLLARYGKTPYTKAGQRGEYEFAPDDADKLLADFAERGRDGVIDYEHQTLSGDKAPAAGWIERLEKTADGVVAHVRYWTEEATKFLREGAYRYFSPVFHVSRRHPMSLHSVALTNHPATHGIPALVTADETDDDETDTHKKETEMREKLLALLGIAALADEAKTDGLIIETVQAMIAHGETLKAFLALHDARDLDAVTGKIKGMVPASELTALNDRLATIEAEKAVTKAFADRKLVEAQRAWALAYAKKDIQAFTDFVAAAPVVAPTAAGATGVKTDGDKGTSKTVALTDDETKVYRLMGLDAEQIEAIRKEKAGA